MPTVAHRRFARAASAALLLLATTPVRGQDPPPADRPETSAPKPPKGRLAERLPVAGTHVALAPPLGFKKADRFVGFAHEERGASIMVVEIPGPFAEVAAGMRDDAQLAKRGMKAVSRADVAIGERTALLLRATQSQQGVAYEKHILVAPTPTGSVVVTAVFRAADAEALAEPLEAAVRGVEISQSKHADVPQFEVGPSNRLVLAHSAGGAAAYCEKGKFGKTGPSDPLFVVARSVSPVEVGRRSEFARQRIAKTAGLSDVREDPPKETRLGGLAGVELTASAKDEKSGTEMFVFQVILFEETGGYWALQGMVAMTGRAAWEEEFRAMAGGFRRTKTGD